MKRGTQARRHGATKWMMVLLAGGCHAERRQQWMDAALQARATAAEAPCGTVACECDGEVVTAAVHRMDRHCVPEQGCFEGLTVLPRLIFVAGESCDQVAAHAVALGHECRHVCQVHKLGVKRYVAGYLRETVLHGYRQNRFEREAFEHPAEFEYQGTKGQ